MLSSKEFSTSVTESFILGRLGSEAGPIGFISCFSINGDGEGGAELELELEVEEHSSERKSS